MCDFARVVDLVVPDVEVLQRVELAKPVERLDVVVGYVESDDVAEYSVQVGEHADAVVGDVELDESAAVMEVGNV